MITSHTATLGYDSWILILQFLGFEKLNLNILYRTSKFFNTFIENCFTEVDFGSEFLETRIASSLLHLGQIQKFGRIDLAQIAQFGSDEMIDWVMSEDRVKFYCLNICDRFIRTRSLGQLQNLLKNHFEFLNYAWEYRDMIESVVREGKYEMFKWLLGEKRNRVPYNEVLDLIFRSKKKEILFGLIEDYREFSMINMSFVKFAEDKCFNDCLIKLLYRERDMHFFVMSVFDAALKKKNRSLTDYMISNRLISKVDVQIYNERLF